MTSEVRSPRSKIPELLTILMLALGPIPALSGALEDGAAALREGDYDRAIVLLDRALEENPELEEAYLLAAKAHLEVKDLIGAAEVLERALKRFPEAGIYAQLGAIYVQVGDYKRAIPPLEEALKLDPSNPDYRHVLWTAYFDSGVEAYRRKEVGHAKEMFRRAWRLVPDDIRPLHNLAAILLEEGKPDSALIFLKRALELSPEDPGLLRLEAAAYRKKGEYGRLLEVYEKLYELQPDSVGIGLDLAMLYRYKRRIKEALDLYDTLMARFPRERRVYRALAGFYRDHFDYGKVREVYSKLLQVFPKDREALEEIARAYEAEGKWGKAQEVYRGMLKDEPGDKEVLLLLAEACRRGGNWDGMAEALERYLETSEDKMAWLGLGDAYERLGMFDKALSAYFEAASIDTLWGEPWKRMAEVYEKRGKKEEAVKAYRRAIEAGTADPVPYHRLALHYLEAGDTLEFYDYERRAVVKAIKAVAQTEGALRSGLRRIEMDRVKIGKLSDLAGLAETYRRTLRDCLDHLSCDPGFDALLDDLIRRYPGAKALWEYKGKYELSRGNMEGALKAFERLVRLDPSCKPGQRGMAEVLERMGRTRDAIAAYERLLQIDPNDEEPYRALIRLYKEEGNLSDLISKWEREREFHPERALLQKYLSIALREVER